jgi:endonuclease/exonuclease/phosphatase (EEP) superfamily protein YafD
VSFNIPEIFWALLSLGSLIAAILSLVGYFGERFWLLELCSHFRLQYFIFLCVSAVLFLLGDRIPTAIFSAFFAFVNLATILPLYRKFQKKPSEGENYRALLVNVLQDNRAYRKVGCLLQSTNPDFAMLVEVNPEWLEGLKQYVTDFPYGHSVLRTDKYGLAFLSRHPISHINVHFFGDAYRPTLVATLDINGHQLTLIGTHPPPPRSRLEAHQRNRQIAELAAFIHAQESPLILLGDLNMTSWSPVFSRFIKSTGLQDTRLGFGIQASWPTNNPLVQVPIDHILVSPHIVVHDRRLGPRVGSDHKPVILKFSIALYTSQHAQQVEGERS